MTFDARKLDGEYPFASHYLDVGGARCHYVDEGSGPPLLFVHGNPTWSFYFRNLIKTFRSTHRVIAIDHVGCGLSDKPSDYPYRLDTHIENLRRLVDHLGLDDVTLAVHDWGGPIGLGAFADAPNRVQRVILFNTAAFRSRLIPWRIAIGRWPVVGPIAIRGLNAFVRCSLRWATSKAKRWTRSMRAGYLAPYDSWAHRVAVLRFVQDIPLAPSHPSYAALARVEESLPLFAAKPILIAWGMKDWCFTPSFLNRFVEFFPHAQIARFADSSHFVVEDAFEEVVALFRQFLAAPA